MDIKEPERCVWTNRRRLGSRSVKVQVTGAQQVYRQSQAAAWALKLGEFSMCFPTAWQPSNCPASKIQQAA